MAQLLTIHQIAQRAKLHRKTVEGKIHDGEIPAFQLGERGSYRVKEEDYEAWVNRRPVRRTESSVPALTAPPPARRGRLIVDEDMRRRSK